MDASETGRAEIEAGRRLGTLMRVKRVVDGLSGSELARLLNLSRPALSRIEQGKTFPSPRTLVQLCQWLGVSAEYIVTGEELSMPACSRCAEYELILKQIQACLPARPHRKGDDRPEEETGPASPDSDPPLPRIAN